MKKQMTGERYQYCSRRRSKEKVSLWVNGRAAIGGLFSAQHREPHPTPTNESGNVASSACYLRKHRPIYA